MCGAVNSRPFGLNAFPYTSFTQNIGISMTGRFCLPL